VCEGIKENSFTYLPFTDLPFTISMRKKRRRFEHRDTDKEIYDLRFTISMRRRFEHRDTEVLMKKKMENTEASLGSFGCKATIRKETCRKDDRVPV
jgi:hypothetical protein